jgi:hypothetical protein
MRELIPAEMHGTLQEYAVNYLGNTLNFVKTSEKTKAAKWPIWVRDTARPADDSSISIQQFHNSGADMWMRGKELRKTGPYDMDCGAPAKRDNEWLSCGPIPISCIVKGMPFDGNKLYRGKQHKLVRSRESLEIYIYNFDK